MLDPSSATLNKYEQLELSLSGDMADLLKILGLGGFKLKALIKFNGLTFNEKAEGLKVEVFPLSLCLSLASKPCQRF